MGPTIVSPAVFRNEISLVWFVSAFLPVPPAGVDVPDMPALVTLSSPASFLSLTLKALNSSGIVRFSWALELDKSPSCLDQSRCSTILSISFDIELYTFSD